MSQSLDKRAKEYEFSDDDEKSDSELRFSMSSVKGEKNMINTANDYFLKFTEPFNFSLKVKNTGISIKWNDLAFEKDKMRKIRWSTNKHFEDVNGSKIVKFNYEDVEGVKDKKSDVYTYTWEGDKSHFDSDKKSTNWYFQVSNGFLEDEWVNVESDGPKFSGIVWFNLGEKFRAIWISNPKYDLNLLNLETSYIFPLKDKETKFLEQVYEEDKEEDDLRNSLVDFRLGSYSTN